MSDNQYIREGIFNAGMNSVEKRMDALESRMTRIEDRMTRLEERVGNVEGDVKALKSTITAINDRITDMNGRIGDIVRRFDSFREELKAGQSLSLAKWGIATALFVGAVQVVVSFFLR